MQHQPNLAAADRTPSKKEKKRKEKWKQLKHRFVHSKIVVNA
jgi:hypothetical protein